MPQDKNQYSDFDQVVGSGSGTPNQKQSPYSDFDSVVGTPKPAPTAPPPAKPAEPATETAYERYLRRGELPKNPLEFVEIPLAAVGDLFSSAGDIAARLTPTKVKEGGKKALSTIAPVLDFVSRPSYGVAKYLDALGPDADNAALALAKSAIQYYAGVPATETVVGKAVKEGVKEVISPKERLDFKDVIKKRYPDFSRNYPATTEALSFIGTVATDPTTYLTLGTGTELKIGAKAATKLAEESLERGVRAGSRRAIVALGEAGTDSAIDLQRAIQQNLRETVTTEARPAVTAATLEQPEIRSAFSKLGTDDLDDISQMFRDADKRFKKSATQVEQNIADSAYSKVKSLTPEENKALGQVLPERKFAPVDEAYIGEGPYTRQVRDITSAEPNAQLDANLESLKSFFGPEGTAARGASGVYSATSPEARLVLAKELETVLGPENLQKLGKGKGAEEIAADLLNARGMGGERMVVIRDIAAEEARQTTEKTLSFLADASPEYAKALTTGKGLRLELPFSKLGVTIVPPEALAEVRRVTGLTALGEQLNRIKQIPQVGKAIGVFSRDFELSPAVREISDELFNRRQIAERDALLSIRDAIRDVEPARREAVLGIPLKVEETIRTAEEQLGRRLTSAEETSILRRELAQQNLKPAEIAALAKNNQVLSEIKQAQQLAGLTEQTIKTYDPKLFELINDPENYARLVKEGGRDAMDFIDLATLEDAANRGLSPNLDALSLQAQKIATERFKIDKKLADELLEARYGTSNLNDAQIPERVKKDYRFYGYGENPLSGRGKQVLQLIGKVNRGFETAATVARGPAFAIPNLASDLYMSTANLGAKALRAWDPRGALDAALGFLEFAPTVLGRSRAALEIPDFIEKAISKFTGQTGASSVLSSRQALAPLLGTERIERYLEKLKLRSALGEELSGTQLMKEIDRNQIAPNMDVRGEGFKKKILSSPSFDPETVPKVGVELMKFWRWPSMISDYVRMEHYINARRIGMSEKQAAQSVNRALFDYQKALSVDEQTIIKKLLPLYTFNRLAIPEVLRQAFTKPGNIVTTARFMPVLEKLVMTGDPLTPAEERIAGDSMLFKQPRLFLGKGADGDARWLGLGGFVPFDVVNIAQFDDDGSLNLRRSVQQQVLARLTPAIKIPVEVLANRNFFSDRVITQDAGERPQVGSGKLGKVDYLGKYLPPIVKDLIGWEPVVNSNGETTVYVSPYMAHVAMSYLPAIGTYIRPVEEGQRPWEAAMGFITGAEVRKMDLGEEYGRQVAKENKQIDALKSELRQAMQLADSETPYGQERIKKLEAQMRTLLDALNAKDSEIERLGGAPQPVPLGPQGVQQ
jgi:hypothetical protein